MDESEEYKKAVEHDCRGSVYYRHCMGCAARLLKNSLGSENHLMAMRHYLVKANQEDPDQIDDIISRLRRNAR